MSIIRIKGMNRSCLVWEVRGESKRRDRSRLRIDVVGDWVCHFSSSDSGSLGKTISLYWRYRYHVDGYRVS
jgi:hypothetical protein